MRDSYSWPLNIIIMRFSALDDSKSGFHGEERVVQSYEDLVRNYVVSHSTLHLPVLFSLAQYSVSLYT